jgi:hypothetical protein
MLTRFLCIALTIGTVGCGSESAFLPTAPTAMSDVTTAPGSPGVVRPMAVQESVTGNAEITDNSYPEGPVYQKYSFNASRRDDGLVTGQFELHQEFAPRNATLHGRVVCFTTLGNTARIGAVIEDSSDPFYQVGGGIGWQVIDAGEGNDPPDQASLMEYTFSNMTCGQSALPPIPSQNGNIQVHVEHGLLPLSVRLAE